MNVICVTRGNLFGFCTIPCTQEIVASALAGGSAVLCLALPCLPLCFPCAVVCFPLCLVVPLRSARSLCLCGVLCCWWCPLALRACLPPACRSAGSTGQGGTNNTHCAPPLSTNTSRPLVTTGVGPLGPAPSVWDGSISTSNVTRRLPLVFRRHSPSTLNILRCSQGKASCDVDLHRRLFWPSARPCLTFSSLRPPNRPLLHTIGFLVAS